MLISIEGLDGSGKETLVRELSKRLKEEYKLKVGSSGYPTYKEGSQVIVNYLNGNLGKIGELDPLLVANFFSMDRLWDKENLEMIINENDITVLDRYVGSNMYHQGCMVEVGQLKNFCMKIKELEYDVYELRVPDITIWIDNGRNGEPINLRTLIHNDNKKDLHEKNVGYQLKAYETIKEVAKLEGWQKISLFDESGNVRNIEDMVTDAVRVINYFM